MKYVFYTLWGFITFLFLSKIIFNNIKERFKFNIRSKFMRVLYFLVALYSISFFIGLIQPESTSSTFEVIIVTVISLTAGIAARTFDLIDF
jgi:hypothetical protein